jgi:hypothetical protein
VQPESNPEAEDPVVAMFDGSSWSFEEIDVSTAEAGYILTSVSCASTQECVAVGRVGSGSDYSKNLVETFNGQTWTSSTLPNPGQHPGQIGGLAGVSCPSVSRCVAVGFYSTDSQEDLQGFSEVMSGHRWHLDSTPLLPGSNALFGVTCPSNGSCTAVGDQDGQEETLIEKLSNNSWSEQSDTQQGQLRSVSCPSTLHCAAVGYEGTSPLVMTYSGGTWSTATSTDPVDETYGLGGLSCASARLCIAGGWGIAGPQRNLDGYLLSGTIPRQG